MSEPIKKLLVGVDFSEMSRHALQRAYSIAQKGSFAVEGLHVFNDFFYKGGHDPAGFLEISTQIESNISKALQTFVAESGGGDFSIETNVRIGLPDQEIIARGKEEKAAMIFLGAHGEKRLENLFLGRVSEVVASNATVPVWIEKENRVEKISEILLPTDLSPHSRIAVLEGLKLAKLCGSKAVVVHVFDLPYIPPLSMTNSVEFQKKMLDLAREDLDKFVRTLPSTEVSCESLLIEGHVVVALEKLAKTRKSGLMVFSRHGATTPIFKPIGSNATKMIRHSPCSVLVVP